MKNEIKIGLFSILMIGAAWAGIRFFSGRDVFRRNVEYCAVYEQISGLKNASSIMIKGVKVGTVTKIVFDPSRDENVYLELSIERRYKIPKDSRAKIITNGLMGGKIVDITLGSSEDILSAGDFIITQEEVNIIASATSEFESLKDKLEILNNDMTRTLRNINLLLESNHQHINGLLSNMEGITGNLDTLLSTRKGDLGRMIGGFAEFSEALGRNSERMDSIMLNMAGVSTQLYDANLGSTVEGLNATLVRLNSSEGSIGKLLTDEMLYNNLSSASSSLDSLFIDLRENPKRYVHFSLFGKRDK